MLNRTIIAAFLATSAAAFGIVSAAAATGERCDSARCAPERLGRPFAKPLGTVDSAAPGEERSEPPRIVRA